MSSTNRGAERADHDNYPTPTWCTRRLLEACPLPGGQWWEPACGEGAIVRAVNDVRSDVLWETGDIRLVAPMSGVRAHRCHDYLKFRHGGPKDDVLITNPPFCLAFEFAQKACEEARWVALLLRLNFIGGGEKSGKTEWLRHHTPDIYVLPNRPSFTGKGTDSIEYAWFVWRPERFEEPRTKNLGAWTILDSTPLEERKRG